MATSFGKPCELCLKPISDIKYYRSLATEASKIYSALLTELSVERKGYAYKFCVNKLNRLVRLDEEIRTRLDVLKQKRSEVNEDLKKVTCNRPNISSANSSLQTPIKKISKREYKTVSKTPTPRKFKARRILPLAGASPSSVQKNKERGANHASSPARKPTTVDSSTQTKSSEEKDFAVKIFVKYGSNYRSRIINSEVQKSVCKAILNNRNPATYIKSLTKDDQFKSALLDCLCKEIRKEVCNLCRKDETLLKYDNNIKWRNILDELVLKAPTIVRIFQSIVSKDIKSSSSRQYTNNLCTALSILLYGRNRQLSQIQYVIGFVLDQCGATKEAISILHDMGISVTQSTIHKKKKILVKQQEDRIRETAQAYTEQRKLILLGEAVIDSDSQRKEEILPCDHHSYADVDILSAKSKLHILSNGCGATYSGCETTALYDSCLEPYSTANTPVTLLTESKEYSSRIDISVNYDKIPVSNSCIVPCGTFSSEIYSTASHDKSMERLKKEIKRAKQNPVKAIEVLGDNLDLLVSPGDMTSDRQRKSWHWFLVLLAQKRITAPDLPSSGRVADILHLEASNWLPSNEEILRYRQDLQIHVAKILVKNFAALKHLEKVLPKYIPHEFIEITKQKTVFFNTDLIDASENSTEGMIHILQQIHNLVVPHCVVDSKEVCEPVVFGGDVLTNERAFGAQMAMFNNKSEFKNLLGVIHRPEGLHRQMNFLLEKSSGDPGTLYQLRNLINRRDVTGPDAVTTAYRSHYHFVQDVLEGYIVAAFLTLSGLKDIDDTNCIGFPVFSFMSSEEQLQWILTQADAVMTNLGIDETEAVVKLRDNFHHLDQDMQNIHQMKSPGGFTCFCGKHYKTEGHFRRHLCKVHKWKFHVPPKTESLGDAVSCFLRMACLLFDTNDAYKMADGERCTRNAKLEWLYASATKHYKYQLWLWRMVSYTIALLSPRESFEYKWNISTNLVGGVDKNIPNDNCVELQVKTIKNQLKTQGANKSFNSARVITLTTQVLDDVKMNVMKENNTLHSSRVRPGVDKRTDIMAIANCILSMCSGQVTDLEWKSFVKFKKPLESIDAVKLYQWIDENKIISNNTMLN